MIGVIGSGSWATAVVKILLEQPTAEICWYVREEEIRESLASQGRNIRYLGEVLFDTKRIEVSDDVSSVFERCETVYLVVPTVYLNNTLQGVDPELLKKCNLVSAIKGFVPEYNLLVTEYLQKVYGIEDDKICIISGPTHAEEVARERLTFITAASSNRVLAETVLGQIRSRYITVALSTDVRGIQYAAALKNVYAIGAGICKGMGSGDNLMAVLLSYIGGEMFSFLRQVQPGISNLILTDALPAYVGDLLVTCYSQFSRNRTFGTMIGRGYSVRSAQLEMNMVAEGYYASKSLEIIRQQMGIEMPIAQAIHRVLYHGAKPEVIQRTWQIKKVF